MIDVFPFNGIPVAVLGLGKSGRTAAEALRKSGADVRAWDDKPETRDKAAAAGIPIVDLMAMDWSEVPTLVLSPGIPHSFPKPHPVVTRAKAASAEIISDDASFRPRSSWFESSWTTGPITRSPASCSWNPAGRPRKRSGSPW